MQQERSVENGDVTKYKCHVTMSPRYFILNRVLPFKYLAQHFFCTKYEPQAQGSLCIGKYVSRNVSSFGEQDKPYNMIEHTDNKTRYTGVHQNASEV
jgi:hypothetical protein